jgi:ABC-type antimicrobial peptide transport system permease subunit
MYVAVRSARDPLELAGPAVGAVHALDPTLPVANVEPLERVVADSLDRPRFLALLLGVFALVALTLAAVGTYGVLAYAVAQRRHEVGVRMALGATARNVLRLIVGQGMRPVIAGLALGVLAALLLRRLLASQLYGIAPTDLVTFTVVPVLLLAVALVACLIPGRSATKVDPVVALRQE